jgi:hypothetical protein
MDRGKVPPGYRLLWPSVGAIASQRYTCGYCGHDIASEKGWVAVSTYDKKEAAYVAICHFVRAQLFWTRTSGNTRDRRSDRLLRALMTALWHHCTMKRVELLARAASRRPSSVAESC